MNQPPEFSATSGTAAPLSQLVLDALPFTICSVDLDGVITSANRAATLLAVANRASDAISESGERSGSIGSSIFSMLPDGVTRAQITDAMLSLQLGQIAQASWEFTRGSTDQARVFVLHLSAVRLGTLVTGYVFATVEITRSQQSRDAQIDAGAALASAVSLEQVYNDVAKEIHRVMQSHALVIALVDPESQLFGVVYSDGYLAVRERDRARAYAHLAQRLDATWRNTVATSNASLANSDAGVEITVPLVSNDRALGVMTVATRSHASSHALDDAARALTMLATQATTAIERAWLVQHLQQQQRLESVGEVAAGVAHELRNPLFGISSSAQLLQFRSKGDPMVEKNVARILREVERLNRMVTSLLEFGRPEPIRLVAGNPDSLWDDILQAESERIRGRHLVVERTRSDVSVACALDKAQLGQVFRNVLANAVDASADDATITVTSSITPAGSWRCHVHNDGPVIPADVLPHVFEFFYSTKAGGTGVGLALCLRIVTEHRGTITLDSTASDGTTLTITLPPITAT